ncbi:MAG: GGDEF domain-containing protein, partial [Aestuariivirgaceae bacterium]
EIDQIHDELRRADEASRHDQDATGEKLGQEMDAIIAMVSTYLASSESYSGSLSRTADSLSDTAKPEQIRKTIELLISENDKMRSETASLTHSLEQTKDQVEELRTNLEKARESGLRDALTNLGNRRRFELVLTKEVAEAQATQSPMCLAIGDLDHFKRVNDTFGHPIGDEVLKFFGSLMSKNVKGRDTAARYGGEEFAIILPETSRADAEMLIEKIRSQLETTDLVLSKSQKRLGKVTASFGIAQLRPDDDPSTLVERADAKLYEAKNGGRNRIVCDSDE